MRKVLIILFLAINSVLSATNYYVKNGGNDSNSGLDDTNAWAHHPWMSTWTGSAILVAGDNVFMKRGDTWTDASSSSFMYVGQSGTAGNPITATWYGASGNKPLIQITGDYPYPVIQGTGKSFITFDHLDIKHHSSTRNTSDGQFGIVFGKDGSRNISHDWIITNCDIHNIPFTGIAGTTDSYNIIIGDTTAFSCATSNSYSNHIYNCGYAGVGMGGCDPSTGYSNFDIYYNYIHDINTGGAIGVDTYGIYFSAAASSSGWPKYCVARFNLVKNIVSWEGIDTHGGQYIYFQDNYIYNCRAAIGTQLVAVGTLTPILDHCYIERNTIENPGDNPGLKYYFIQMQGPTGGTYRATNSYIRDNILFYTSRPSGESSSYGIRLGPADGVTIERNIIYNGPVGTCSGAMNISGTGSPAKNVIVRDNWISNWNWGILFGIGGIDGDITFSNNIIYSNGMPFGTYEAIPSSFSGNITIYNNVFLSVPTAVPPYDIDFSKTIIPIGSSLIIKNNILGFTSPASLGRYIRIPNAIAGTLEIDYNLYWNSTKSDPYDLLSVSYNWADWNAHGYDTHSLNNTNPLFRNNSGSYSKDFDFVLQSTSPAINKGTVVSEVAHDFFGNPRDATPDIGANEYYISDQTVSVTGITVTGAGGETAITTDKGIIQLTTAVSPANATNKTVTWSIANGTGQATINSTGLVIAITNGTVTARATATDGSGVYGTLVITISNQVVPVNLVYISTAIENSTPTLLEMTYNLILANIMPAASAFSILVNSSARTVNNVAISGTKVLLTLASPVAYKDLVTIAYTTPSANPLQSTTGEQAATISVQPVTNNVSFINTPPVVVVNYQSSIYSGFVSEIDATGSYDPNNDNLSYTWVVPDNMPVSSTSGSEIQFLGPIVNAPQTVEFTVKISDGKTTQSKVIPVEILPYKPELEVAEVLNVEASGFQSPYYPYNILDGNIGTMWSADGDNQWLIMTLKELFNIQHVKIAFQPGQKRESYFDILGSEDKLTWEPILTKSASCAFSGDIQVFDFPLSKTGKEFRYVKLVGHSNSVSTWNYISEFKIFGYKHRSPSSYEEQPIKIYPNPAHEFINIRNDEPTLVFDFIRIINLSGKIVFQDKVNPDIKELRIPINLIQGVYVVQMGSGDLTLFTQKLIVGKNSL